MHILLYVHLSPFHFITQALEWHYFNYRCYYYNFLDVAEYIGNVPAEKREEVIQQLNKEVERLIKVSQYFKSMCTC